MNEPKFKRGDRVRKTKGSQWHGTICGFYSTGLTPVGYCVESEREKGSVQIYPESALELQPPSKERPNDTPLWKDDSEQEVRDFRESARFELLLYGFAAVKQLAIYDGKPSGKTECPLCQKQVRWRIASSNGHCAAKCETEKCINATE